VPAAGQQWRQGVTREHAMVGGLLLATAVVALLIGERH